MISAIGRSEIGQPSQAGKAARIVDQNAQESSSKFDSLGNDLLLELLIEVGPFRFAPFRLQLRADSTVQLQPPEVSLFPAFPEQGNLRHGCLVLDTRERIPAEKFWPCAVSLLILALSGLKLQALLTETRTRVLERVVDFTPFFLPLFSGDPAVVLVREQ